MAWEDVTVNMAEMIAANKHVKEHYLPLLSRDSDGMESAWDVGGKLCAYDRWNKCFRLLKDGSLTEFAEITSDIEPTKLKLKGTRSISELVKKHHELRSDMQSDSPSPSNMGILSLMEYSNFMRTTISTMRVYLNGVNEKIKDLYDEGHYKGAFDKDHDDAQRKKILCLGLRLPKGYDKPRELKEASSDLGDVDKDALRSFLFKS